MTKIIIIHAVFFVFVTLIFHKATSQILTDQVVLNLQTSETDLPDLNPGIPANTGKNYRNDISIRAVRGFLRYFKTAKNVTWQITRIGGGYTAQFTNDSIQTKVAYDRRGGWYYTFRRYEENRMQPDLRNLVRSSYYDYTIMEVTEIIMPPETLYIRYSVLINKADNFKILKICNREMEIVCDYSTLK